MGKKFRIDGISRDPSSSSTIRSLLKLLSKSHQSKQTSQKRNSRSTLLRVRTGSHHGGRGAGGGRSRAS